MEPAKLACFAVLLFSMSARMVLCALPQPSALSLWFEGTASFFGGPADSNSGNEYKLTIDSGSCGYGDIDPRLYPFYNVIGLHPSNSIVMARPEAACGSCLEIECHDSRSVCYPAKPLKAIITDQCDQECNATNVNMHVFAFEQLAPLRIGRMGIRYRLVECDPADPITIHVSDYRASEGGWIRMSFKNVAGDGGLLAVELAKSTNSMQAGNSSTHRWLTMQNTFGANWELSSLPTPPLDIRLTNTIRQKVIIRHAITIAGATGDIETSAQFPLAAAATTKNGTVLAVPAAANAKKQSIDTLSFAPNDVHLNTFIPGKANAAQANNNAGVVDIGEAILPQQNAFAPPRDVNSSMNVNGTTTVPAALPSTNVANINSSTIKGQNTSRPIGRRMFFFRH